MPANVVRNQKGWVSIMVMVLMPLFMLVLAGSMELPRVMHGSNTDVEKAVEMAVKAAANCTDPSARANGMPYIDTNKAYTVFIDNLQKNLGLNPDWTPKNASGVEEVLKYQFVIINGINTFTDPPNAFGIPGKTFYDNSSLGTDDYSGPMLPYTLGIGNEGITAAGNGIFDTTIKSPSCVAWVKVKLKSVAAEESPEVIRWGVGRLVKK